MCEPSVADCVRSGGVSHLSFTEPSLHKALWANIAKLRVAESRRNERDKKLRTTLTILVIIAFALILFLFF